MHLGFRGNSVGSSVRCAWRGVARTAAQREQAIRLWLGLASADPLPEATEVERRFMEELDQYDLALPQTARTSFKVLARGGLSPFRHAIVNFWFLHCGFCAKRKFFNRNGIHAK